MCCMFSIWTVYALQNFPGEEVIFCVCLFLIRDWFSAGHLSRRWKYKLYGCSVFTYLLKINIICRKTSAIAQKKDHENIFWKFTTSRTVLYLTTNQLQAHNYLSPFHRRGKSKRQCGLPASWGYSSYIYQITIDSQE